MFRKKDEAYYERELQRVTKERELFDRREEIEDIKRGMRRWNPPTTTKVIMLYIFLNCTAVEIYSMVAMWYLQNLDALYALITAVVSESLSFAVYAAKAYNETKQEELVKLERDKMAMEEGEDGKAAGEEETDSDYDGSEAAG